MNKLDLNELSHWSQWPARLLESSTHVTVQRTLDKVDQEYDKDKYAKCLAYYIAAEKQLTPEEVKEFEFGVPSTETMCVSQGNELWLASLGEARERFYALLRETMRAAIQHSTSIVELGCGYGYNLWMLQQSFPHKAFVGGEYSINAVQLAQHLYSGRPCLSVESFNFYDPAWQVLERLQPPITLFTVHTIEQLPSAQKIFDVMGKYRDRISAVFHFEPVHELYDETLLGLLRRRYTLVNDYNQDLLSTLQQASGRIRIVNIKANVFGLNPLNPTSVLHWEFAG